MTYAFNRADRPPPWNTRPSSDDPFPVVLVRNPAELAGLVAAVREQATATSPFLLIECSIDGTPYQVVAHAFFASSPPHHLLGFMAFTVNMLWVHAQYFDPLVNQVEKIAAASAACRSRCPDDEGRMVTSSPVEPEGAGDLHTPLPPAVHRPGARHVDRVAAECVREWTVHVRSLPDRTLVATLRGARRMFVLITVAAGCHSGARAHGASGPRQRQARVDEVGFRRRRHPRAEDTRRVDPPGRRHAGERPLHLAKTVQEYARLLSVEASRLGTSIDNLLTYARYSRAQAADLTEARRRRSGRPGRGRTAGFRPTSQRSNSAERRCATTSAGASTVRPSFRRSRTSSTTRSTCSCATRRLAVSGQRRAGA